MSGKKQEEEMPKIVDDHDHDLLIVPTEEKPTVEHEKRRKSIEDALGNKGGLEWREGFTANWPPKRGES